MKTTNFTDFRDNLEHYLDNISEDAPLTIRCPEGGSVVVISLKDYNSFAETAYLLSNPANVEHLRRSIEEINNGEDVKIDIKDLWK